MSPPTEATTPPVIFARSTMGNGSVMLLLAAMWSFVTGMPRGASGNSNSPAHIQSKNCKRARMHCMVTVRVTVEYTRNHNKSASQGRDKRIPRLESSSKCTTLLCRREGPSVYALLSPGAAVLTLLSAGSVNRMETSPCSST